MGHRCWHVAVGRVRRVQTERGVYVDGPLCGRCWRELLASDAGPASAAADPYAPRWVLSLVMSGGSPELVGAVAARGAARLPRSVRRRLAAAGVRVPQGVGVVEVARWVRVSRHGRSRMSAWPMLVAGAFVVAGVVAAVVLTRPADDEAGASASSTTSVTSLPSTTDVSSSSVPEPSSSVPSSTSVEVAVSMPAAPSGQGVTTTVRTTLAPSTTTAPSTTAVPVVKTVSVSLGAGCTRVSYESTSGVLSVALLRDGDQVASGSTSATWSGPASASATWSARLTVSGTWAGSFWWEGC